MIHQQQFSDEILMAYADGELDTETALAVSQAIKADAAVADRVALFSRTSTLLGAAAQARPHAPLPPELAGKVNDIIADAKAASSDQRGSILRFPQRTERPSAPMPVRYGIAASIALAVGLAGGYLLPRGLDGTGEAGLFAGLETPALTTALTSIPSGERSALAQGEIEMIATFTNAENELCREFEYAQADQAAIISVACLDGSQWQTRFAVVSSAADATDYVPASSLAALDAYLASIGAGAPLDSDAEMTALQPLD